MNQKKKLVVVGSVAIDWVITPHAEREESVGGAATYFSMAASHHTPVHLVGVVGKDFPKQALAEMKQAGVDLEGLEVEENALTFRWKGRYHENMNQRDTLETHLNCFESFSPKLPESYKNADMLFLANIQPNLQLQVLEQMNTRPGLVGLDTMNLWIDIASDDLRAVVSKVDVLTINEEEALQMTGSMSLLDAAKEIRKIGPKILVIKRGEYGALLFGPEENDLFAAPAMPLADVHDPTGAGDCFAGGFMGYLCGAQDQNSETLRKAVIWGSVMASFCVQGFSYDTILELNAEKIEARYKEFVALTQF